MTRGFASNPRPANVHITLAGSIVAETPKAILFKVKEISNSLLVAPAQEWFPISQISKISRAAPSAVEGEDMIIVSEWIYLAKGLDKLVRQAPGFVDTEDPLGGLEDYDTETLYRELDPENDIPF